MLEELDVLLVLRPVLALLKERTYDRFLQND